MKKSDRFRIYKYALPIEDEVFVHMPVDAKILTVQAQGDELQIWALVDLKIDVLTQRRFRVVQTGQPCGDVVGMDYVGTVQFFDGSPTVFHVFAERSDG